MLNIQKKINLAKYSTLKIGGSADYFVIVKNSWFLFSYEYRFIANVFLYFIFLLWVNNFSINDRDSQTVAVGYPDESGLVSLGASNYM